MPKAYVLFDSIGYQLETEVTAGNPYGIATMFANHGEQVELPKSELDRLSDLGAIGTLEELEAIDAPPAPEAPEAGLDDEAIGAMSVDELGAYLSQNPDQLDHVEELEAMRPKPRKTAGELFEAMRDALADADLDAGGLDLDASADADLDADLDLNG